MRGVLGRSSLPRGGRAAAARALDPHGLRSLRVGCRLPGRSPQRHAGRRAPQAVARRQRQACGERARAGRGRGGSQGGSGGRPDRRRRRRDRARRARVGSADDLAAAPEADSSLEVAPRVLLVGSDRRFRSVAAALLQRRGYSVALGEQVATMAEDAVRERADVVVLDAGTVPSVAALEAARLEAMNPSVGMVLGQRRRRG